MQNRVNSHSGLNQKPAKHQPTCNHGHQDTESVCTIHANNGTVRQGQSPGFTHDFYFKFPDFSQTLLSLKKLLLSYTHFEYSRLKFDKFGVFLLSSVVVSPISSPFCIPFLQIMLTVIMKFPNFRRPWPGMSFSLNFPGKAILFFKKRKRKKAK